jgi:septum formation protein
LARPGSSTAGARTPSPCAGQGPDDDTPGSVAPVAPLILGSASPRRRALLAQIGVVPDAALPAEIDETPRRGELPRAHARRIAAEKNAAVAAAFEHSLHPRAGAPSPLRGEDWGGGLPPGAPNPFILTADTVVGLGRRILGKPADVAEAARFLMLLSGRRHRVTTCVCLSHGARIASRTVETRVRVKRLSDEEISAYLRSGEWRGKAGGYAIQGLFGAFVPEITGSYTNVVGLPLAETAALLTGMGYRVPYEPVTP